MSSSSEASGGAVIIDFPGRSRAPQAHGAAPNARRPALPPHLRIDAGFYRRFNRFCRKHGLRRDEALRLAFDLLRQKIEPARAAKE